MCRGLSLEVTLLVALGALMSPIARADEGAVRVVFVGDIMLDGGPGHLVTLGRDPFADVAPILRDADLTIGNLECAIVKQGHAVDKPYTFRGPARALPLLKRHFSAVSLANNHSGDWGKAGFLTELDLLKETDLPYFGGGANAKEARTPLVLDGHGKRVAFLGYNDFPPRGFAAGPQTPGTAWLVRQDVVRDIALARTRADIVLIFLHWGEDLEPAIAPEQRDMAHAFIDAGADAVIGGHSHLVQDIEWYKDRPIAYGIGNFVFDYFPYDPPVWTGLIVRLTFRPTVGGAGRPELETTLVELDPAGMPHPVIATTTTAKTRP
jgi:poly-gamma-glutamate capsule biosynthesis protein CapA/YwtB (metallophosphatase superfamily)